MKFPICKLLAACVTLLAVSALPLRAVDNPNQGNFFSPEQYLGTDADGNPVYYLSYFDTYTYDPSDDSYVYKYNFGWLYNFGGDTSDSNDVYLYDFAEDDTFYTSASLYPYFYSFNFNSYLYYFEGSQPRQFYDFGSSSYITY